MLPAAGEELRPIVTPTGEKRKIGNRYNFFDFVRGEVSGILSHLI